MQGPAPGHPSRGHPSPGDASAVAPAVQTLRVRFDGHQGEFFRLWLGQWTLTVLTLGLYFPLARRRTRQYLLGHTRIGDSPLSDDTPTGPMLRSFYLVAALFLCLGLLLHQLSAVAASLASLGVIGVIPLLWGSGQRSRFMHTHWRGLRLEFTPTVMQVYAALAPAGLIPIGLQWPRAILALGPSGTPRTALASGLLLAAGASIPLVMAWVSYRATRLVVQGVRLGEASGRWRLTLGGFMQAWLASMGVFAVAAVLVGGALFMMIGGPPAVMPNGRGPRTGDVIAHALPAIVGSMAFAVAAWSATSAWRQASLFQRLWNSTGAGQRVRTRCDLSPWAYTRLQLRGMALGVLTLGLWHPIGLLAKYRMRVTSVTVMLKGDMEPFPRRAANSQDALGDAATGLLDLDVVI